MNNQVTFIDPNTADLETLQQIAGIGPALAERIVAGRPYADLEDLTRVPGIGPAFLDRLRPVLAFLPEDVQEPDPQAIETGITGQAAASGMQEAGTLPAQPEAVADRPALIPGPVLEQKAPQPGTFSRGQALGYALGAGLFSFVFALIVVFAVLVALNGGLRYATPAQIRDLGSEIESLQAETGLLGESLEGLRTRMDNLDALGGRVTTLETGLGGLQAEMESVSGEMDALQTRAEEIAGQVDVLQSDSERYQSFLNGLYELLREFAIFGEDTNE